MSKEISKTLSYVLRHKPESIKLELDKNGWADIEDLLYNLYTYKKIDLTYHTLFRLVKDNDKQRFALNDDKTKIRASQGHSVDVDLDLKAKRPPMKLYHGTVKKAAYFIMKNGLSKMTRHAVHLSAEIETATNVGGRRGKPVILEIASGAMYADNIKFYESANGVWLTDEVLPKYIKIKE